MKLTGTAAVYALLCVISTLVAVGALFTQNLVLLVGFGALAVIFFKAANKPKSNADG